MVFTPTQRKAYDARRREQKRLYDAQRPRRSRGTKGPSSTSAFERGLFIGWDGEGATINGRHEYIMLLNSVGHRLINPTGLTSQEIIPWIMDRAKEMPKNAIHTIFAGGYDVNMILHTLSHATVTKIWNSAKRERGIDVQIDGRIFNIYYRQQKFLRIREFDPDRNKQFVQNEKTGKWTRKPLRSFTLWDVWPFAQTSFAGTIKEWFDTTLTAEEKQELSIIEEHKAKRREFDPKDIEDITAYCTLELKYLVRICQQLHRDLIEAEITINRWDGPGAIAAAMLTSAGIKDYKSPPAEDTTMQAIQFSARMAYAGGRIEIFYLGHSTDTCYHYDVRSAYPSGMSDLPCLACGTWRRTTRYDPNSFGMWEVVWDYTRSYLSRLQGPHPFFFRHSDGSLCYPPQGAGIYHTVEVNTARKHKAPNDKLKITGGWVYHTTCTHKPFAFVPDRYTQRLAWQDQHRSGQRVLKLGLNSIYGKLAQQLGAQRPDTDDGEWERIPPFHELIWAGAVTANTRAKLYDTAMLAPDAVVMIQTDGITFTKDMSEHLSVGKQLGQWEKKANWLETFVIQPGIYFARHGPDHDNPDDWIIHYRGFDPPTRENQRLVGPLTPDAISEAWHDQVTDLPVQSTRFIGMGSCVTRQKKNRWVWQEWCQWPTKDRTCCIYPTERMMVDDNKADWHRGTKIIHGSDVGYAPDEINPADGLIPLMCRPVEPGTSSTPHQINWIDDDGFANYGMLRDEDGIPQWLSDHEHSEGLE